MKLILKNINAMKEEIAFVDIGLYTEQIYEIKRIDLDYFGEE